MGGKFNTNDAKIINSLLPLFVIPAVGWGISNIFFQPLLALKKTKELAILGVIALALGITTTASATHLFGTLYGISIGLIAMLFGGIIGSEILWQYYKKNLLLK